MKRIFSGVQPTGDLHLGNYFGAIKQFVKLQHEGDCLFCVVDMHAITVEHNPALLAQQSREIAAAYIASGIDPANRSIFIQSQVAAHAELCWILQSVARMGWLERMTQFREKTGTVPPADLRDVLKRVKETLDGGAITANTTNERCQAAFGGHDIHVLYEMVAGKASNAERASVGLFTYPVLMAADILAYKGTHVPVGDDQKQHLNLARDIAQKFNSDHKTDCFPIPEAVFGSAPRIMSLQDGTRKMSKSDPDNRSRISFSDTNEAIESKIRRATADTLPFPSSQDEVIKPEIENLITLYTECTGVGRETVFNDFGGKGYGYFKPVLTQAIIAVVEPIRSTMERLLADPRTLDMILDQGAERAEGIASKTLAEVRGIIGFRKR